MALFSFVVFSMHVALFSLSVDEFAVAEKMYAHGLYVGAADLYLNQLIRRDRPQIFNASLKRFESLYDERFLNRNRVLYDFIASYDDTNSDESLNNFLLYLKSFYFYDIQFQELAEKYMNSISKKSLYYEKSQILKSTVMLQANKMNESFLNLKYFLADPLIEKNQKKHAIFYAKAIELEQKNDAELIEGFDDVFCDNNLSQECLYDFFYYFKKNEYTKALGILEKIQHNPEKIISEMQLLFLKIMCLNAMCQYRFMDDAIQTFYEKYEQNIQQLIQKNNRDNNPAFIEYASFSSFLLNHSLRLAALQEEQKRINHLFKNKEKRELNNFYDLLIQHEYTSWKSIYFNHIDKFANDIVSMYQIIKKLDYMSHIAENKESIKQKSVSSHVVTYPIFDEYWPQESRFITVQLSSICSSQQELKP